MKFKVKNLHIRAGGFIVAVLHVNDAIELDVYPGDRISISGNGKKVTAIVDTTHQKKVVPPGSIGMFEELQKRITIKHRLVNVNPEEQPQSVNYIRKKLRGESLSTDEIFQIVRDIADNKLSKIELTYFVAAGYIHNFSLRETYDLTKAMFETGETLKLSSKTVVDKHCIGGIPGNRTTPIVASIVASAGLIIPKTSSRSITSPAGTADTMEVMTNVTLPLKKVREVVKKTGACITWGGALNLAPVDEEIIEAEHPLSIDAEGQLIASILAKKLSVSSKIILLDIPASPDAKVTKKVALRLKRKFIQVARKFGVKVEAIITDGRQPIGNGIGPALEAKDVLYVLRNDERAPKDLRDKSIFLAGKLIELGGKAKKNNGINIAEQILLSGQAFEKFRDIVKAQGLKVIDPDKIKIGKFHHEVYSYQTGKVRNIDNRLIASLAKAAGAPIDKEAGIFLRVHHGDYVKKGDLIFTVYAKQLRKLNYAIKKSKDLPIIRIS